MNVVHRVRGRPRVTPPPPELGVCRWPVGCQTDQVEWGFTLARLAWVHPGDVHFSQDPIPHTLNGMNGPFRGGGGTLPIALGEMDVAQVNRYRSAQSEPPLHLVCFAPRRPAAVAQFRGGGATRDLPLTRWTTFTRPGCHRVLGDGRMGDDVWREHKRIG